jgi:hypothetical protein
MFLPNDVIQYEGQRGLLRVLHVEAERGIVHVFALGRPRGVPQSMALHALAYEVRSGRARLLLDDPYAAPPAPAALPQKHRDLQARAWIIVNSLEPRSPALYDARKRAAMVACCAAEHGVSRASVLRWLRRFWERGQCIEALLPDYANSGARGKTRAATSGVKRGRPRKSNRHAGLNVDEATRAIFRTAVARYLAAHPGAALARRAAYRRMLTDFYEKHAQLETPSFGQFSYWLDKDGVPGTMAAGAAIAPSTPLFAAVQHSSAHDQSSAA